MGHASSVLYVVGVLSPEPGGPYQFKHSDSHTAFICGLGHQHHPLARLSDWTVYACVVNSTGTGNKCIHIRRGGKITRLFFMGNQEEFGVTSKSFYITVSVSVLS